MSMHMLPAMYTTTGKKKGKQKFKSAEAAAKARKNAEAWNQLLAKYDVKQTKPNKKAVHKPTPSNHRHTVFDDAKSLDTGAGVAAKADIPQYTGDAMIGIGQLHKSNSVPVFRKEDAEDQAKMRRN